MKHSSFLRYASMLFDMPLFSTSLRVFFFFFFFGGGRGCYGTHDLPNGGVSSTTKAGPWVCLMYFLEHILTLMR